MDSYKKEDCIFCKVIEGKMNANIVFENNSIIAFRDINPQAPVHILIIPKKHIPMVSECDDSDAELLGEIFIKAKEIAAKEDLSEGYRLVLNNGKSAGQEIFHLHVHLLGGRRMAWPPG